MNDHTTELKKTIVEQLRAGIAVSADTLFFAESTFGVQPPMLEAVLTDPAFEDRELLLPLLLAPDHALRAALEPLLDEGAVSAGDLPHLADAVHRQVPSLEFLLPGGAAFDLRVGRDDIGYLVGKLYLDRSVDASVIGALRRNFSRRTEIEARLMIRCRGVVLNPEKRAFLIRCAEQCGPWEERFLTLLETVLTLLAEMGDDDDADRFVIERRRQVVKTMRHIERFNEKREHYSMEYLMMQRFPVPPQSEDEMRGQLVVLGFIAETILGHPPDPSLRAEIRDLGPYRSGSDLRRLIEDLS